MKLKSNIKLEDKEVPTNGTPLPVSIITIVYNNAEYIKDAIQSVLTQDYPFIEYIVIDGGSNDGTVEIIKEFGEKIEVFISEPDEGIYYALNKGIKHATGDVIGILHSDDLFYDHQVVSDSIQKMKETDSEFCFSDMVIIDKDTGRILRYYMAHYFNRWMFRMGWMPPHPTAFINRSLFNEYGLYSTDYKVIGDFDFFVRIFYKRNIRWTYLDRVTVKMRHGGISNSGFTSKRLIAEEINQSLRSHDIWSIPAFQLGRYLIRFIEFFYRPKEIRCKK
jgi:glycosyltransferase involved in cell wall biosynthesis